MELDYSKLIWEGRIDIVNAIVNEIERLSDEAPINDCDDSLIDLEGLRDDIYNKVEKRLKENNINIEELNKKINNAIFGNDSVKYYAYKGE